MSGAFNLASRSNSTSAYRSSNRVAEREIMFVFSLRGCLAAELAMALLKFADRPQEVDHAESGPVDIGKV